MSGQLRNGAATAALVLGLIGWFVFATTSRYTVLTRDLSQDVYNYPVSTLGPMLLGAMAIILAASVCTRSAGARQAAAVQSPAS